MQISMKAPSTARFAQSVALAGLMSLTMVGCGDDSATDLPPAGEATTTADAGESGTTTTAARATTTKPTSAAPTRLTGQEICDGITANSVGTVITRPVDTATPEGSKCDFTYPASEGNVYFISISDVTGTEATPKERFDAVVAKFGEGVESSPVTAGDQAMKFGSGPTVSGAVLVGEHVFYVADLPEVALESQLEALLQMVAGKLG